MVIQRTWNPDFEDPPFWHQISFPTLLLWVPNSSSNPLIPWGPNDSPVLPRSLCSSLTLCLPFCFQATWLNECSIIILIFIYHQFPCLLLDSLNLPGKKHHLFNYNSSFSPHGHLWPVLSGCWTTMWTGLALNLWLQMVSGSLELAIIPTVFP